MIIHTQEAPKFKRPHLPTGSQTVLHNHSNVNVTVTDHEQTNQQTNQPSALDTVHRSKHSGEMEYEIRPEDVHHEPEPTPAPQPEVEEQKPKKIVPSLRKTEPKEPSELVGVEKSSPKDGTDDLFNMHANNGFIDGLGMDFVLKKLGTMKNFDWRRFDADGDGKLSRTEFQGFFIVAQRFKSRKK